MDTAFKRRWDFTYLGIDDSEAGIVGKKVVLGQGDYRRVVEWNALRKAINNELLTYKAVSYTHLVAKRSTVICRPVSSASWMRSWTNWRRTNGCCPPMLYGRISKSSFALTIIRHRRSECRCRSKRSSRPVSYTHLDVYKRQGQGKSYLMKLLILNLLESGKSIITLDAEHEQREMCEAVGGCFADLMAGQYIINVLEPKCWDDGGDPDDTCLLYTSIPISETAWSRTFGMTTARQAGMCITPPGRTMRCCPMRCQTIWRYFRI